LSAETLVETFDAQKALYNIPMGQVPPFPLLTGAHEFKQCHLCPNVPK